MEGPLQSFLISPRSDYKYGSNEQFLFLIGLYVKNLLLWNHLATWNQTIQEASMGGSLQSFLISTWSDNKHGGHGQFLFLIGWYFKNLLQWNHLAKWNQTTGSIYGRSFTKISYFVPIGLQIWQQRAVLVSDWLIFQKSPPLKPLDQGYSCFWLADIWKLFSSKPHAHM